MNELNNSAPRSAGGKPTLTDWIEGARLRTLPAAAAPVLVGMGGAAHLGAFSLGKAALALAVALLLQVGVNFANDYSDGVRGTDRVRLGPVRLTASGIVPSKQVLAIALTNFALAGVLGVVLIAWAGTWELLLPGVLAVLAAWFYTGGKRPYGYMGVGFSELFVFVFFGLMATVGTMWVQVAVAPVWIWVAASGIGLASVALLLVNNIRDIPTDSKVGKTTAAVRLGERRSRRLYVATVFTAALLGGAAVGIARPTVWLGIWAGVALAGFAVPTVLPVLAGARGPALLRTLRNTGFFALTYGALVGALLAL